jgi:hypothetical protein
MAGLVPGTRTDPNRAAIGRLDLDDLLIDDVPPAMIFKIAHCPTSLD